MHFSEKLRVIHIRIGRLMNNFNFSGDIEKTVPQFANKMKTLDSCDFITDKIVPHPCQANPENKIKAEQICSKITKGSVFEGCHNFVNPETYYEDCIYDMCACSNGDISKCACSILADYATECARQGIILNWRYEVTECGKHFFLICKFTLKV